MKAENVQRKHLQDLRKVKAQESSLPVNKLVGEKGRTARKSTNPLKHAHSSSSSIATVKLDAMDARPVVQEGSDDGDVIVSAPAKECSITVEETKSKIPSEVPPEGPIGSPSEKSATGDADTSSTTVGTVTPSVTVDAETVDMEIENIDDSQMVETKDSDKSEDSSMAKVWATIHNDMSAAGDDEELDDSVEKEEGELSEMDEDILLHEDILLNEDPLDHSILMEEEEPSDWEDREAGLDDETQEDDKLDATPKIVVSECVTISSDDEGSPEKKQDCRTSTPIKETGQESDDEERLQLDSSSCDLGDHFSQNESDVQENADGIDEGSDNNALISSPGEKPDSPSFNLVGTDKNSIDPLEISHNAESKYSEQEKVEKEKTVFLKPTESTLDRFEIVNDKHDEEQLVSTKPVDDEKVNTEHVDKNIDSDHVDEEMDSSEHADSSKVLYGKTNNSECADSEDVDVDKKDESKTFEQTNISDIAKSHVKHNDNVADADKKSNDSVVLYASDDDLIEIEPDNNKDVTELENTKKSNVKVEDSETTNSLPGNSDTLIQKSIKIDSNEIKSPVEETFVKTFNREDKTTDNVEAVNSNNVAEVIDSASLGVQDRPVVEVDLDVHLVEEIEHSKTNLLLVKDDVGNESGKLNQTGKDLKATDKILTDKPKGIDKVKDKKIVSRTESNVTQPEIVEVDLDTDSDSLQVDIEDKDAFDKLLSSSNKNPVATEKKMSEDDLKPDLLKTVIQQLNVTEPDSKTAKDDLQSDELLQVDLDSHKLNLDEDQVKDITDKENMEVDGSLGKSGRKRQLSENSKNNARAMIEKKSKLDLTEEPLEDALKQLDALSNREKKSDEPPPRKLKLTKEILEELISRRITDYINNSQKSIIYSLKTRCENLEKGIDKWRRKAQGLQSCINDLNAELQKHQKKPRGQTRTVGINVRISTVDPLKPLTPKLNQLPPPTKSPQDTTSLTKPAPATSPSQSGGPVPMHLVANTALAPTKTFIPPATPTAVRPPVSATAAPLPSGTVKIIDLTHEDDETAALKAITRQNPPSQSALAAALVSSGTVITTTATQGATQRLQGGMTIQPNTGGQLMGMQVPVTMQIIPTGQASGSGITIRGPRPMNLSPSLAPPGSRVTTYLVPSGPGAMGQPRQLVTFPNPQVMQTATRPGAPMQTFLLTRMNTQPVVSSNFTTISHGPTALNTVSQIRGPPNVTLTARNTLPTSVSINQAQVLNTSPAVSITPRPRPIPSVNTMVIPLPQRHPAPFPVQPTYTPNQQMKSLPPKAALKISKVSNGIVLSWNLTMNSNHAEISKYQLFAYQEGTGPPLSSLWKKVGDVKALPLPMACTLTQFVEGNKYHFAVRAVDKHGRFGPFSDPTSILLPGK